MKRPMELVGILATTTVLVLSSFSSILPTEALTHASENSSSNGSANNRDAYVQPYSYRTVQVQVIHRHGDRTPITPLQNEEYWADQLVPEDLLKKVAQGTKVLRHTSNQESNDGKNELEVHAAAGRGPFGKLTKLGLLGMIQVGSNLKEELEDHTDWAESTTASNTLPVGKSAISDDSKVEAKVIKRKIRLTPKDIKVYSTDFARTIQSVQALLVGVFPDGISNDVKQDDDREETIVHIECRDTTSWMIPDPQPRQTKEQEDLERKLAQLPHVLEKEDSMRPLAVRCTESLLPLLGDGAFGVSFGVEENTEGADGEAKDESKNTPAALSWIQLAEITKCLSVRGMLPDSISADDQEALSMHTAWKWFQSLRSPRLAYLAMRRFTETLARTMQQRDREPPLIVYSCHDSSLVGLLCALHLEQPSVWPEYGAILKVELLEKRKLTSDAEQSTSCDDEDVNHVDHVLRFYLNGELLRSVWNETPRDEISLHEFVHLTSTVGSDPEIA